MAYGRSPKSSQPESGASPNAPKKKKTPLTEEEIAALDEAESYGTPASDGTADFDAMQDSDMRRESTRTMGELVGDEEPMDEVNFADLAGMEDEEMPMGGLVAGALSPKPMGKNSTIMDKGDSAYRITSGEEPMDDEDMGSMMAPKFDKSELMDPTMGARQAGIPEETLAVLFKKTHGGKFNPESRVDRMKMSTIRNMIQEDKSLLGLTPAKFAMRAYAR